MISQRGLETMGSWAYNSRDLYNSQDTDMEVEEPPPSMESLFETPPDDLVLSQPTSSPKSAMWQSSQPTCIKSFAEQGSENHASSIGQPLTKQWGSSSRPGSASRPRLHRTGPYKIPDRTSSQAVPQALTKFLELMDRVDLKPKNNRGSGAKNKDKRPSLQEVVDIPNAIRSRKGKEREDIDVDMADGDSPSPALIITPILDLSAMDVDTPRKPKKRKVDMPPPPLPLHKPIPSSSPPPAIIHPVPQSIAPSPLPQQTSQRSLIPAVPAQRPSAAIPRPAPLAPLPVEPPEPKKEQKRIVQVASSPSDTKLSLSQPRPAAPKRLGMGRTHSLPNNATKSDSYSAAEIQISSFKEYEGISGHKGYKGQRGEAGESGELVGVESNIICFVDTVELGVFYHNCRITNGFTLQIQGSGFCSQENRNCHCRIGC
ncbi:hypothetical protein C8J56DRAFT_267982 [Mycena floridula]|nr:hypothetical protein C8J56DRAFT_267982 [Mycena floridula]